MEKLSFWTFLWIKKFQILFKKFQVRFIHTDGIWSQSPLWEGALYRKRGCGEQTVLNVSYLILMGRICNFAWFIRAGSDIFFSFWIFFHEHSGFTGQQRKGEDIHLTLFCHFHPLHIHFDISQAITTESSPLHIANSRIWTRNLWFPSASR